ncbi:MAG: nuclear transport factor 2 family protein [Acidimicrobiia bacterium]|nr:nuclear transport factor 2 family protein [Acidimicrobiia bacterium]
MADSTEPATPLTPAEVVDCYIAAFADDREGWLGLFAVDAVVEDPVGSPPHQGTEAIGAFWDASQAMADSIRLVRTGPVRVAGQEAAFPMQARPLIGGTEFVVDIIDVMAFDTAGRITSLRAFWDPTTMRAADGD